jgi:RimJ/RimL family protein N-acetyltransferase
VGGESSFDDFGPSTPATEPRAAELEDRGGLTVLDGAGQVAGAVSWVWMQWGPNRASRCPMIGIWIRPEFRGRGLGTAAQAALVDLFFRHTTANRVEAHTDVENVAEQRALEAAGFRREGVTRGAQWRDGGYHDGVRYAVLRDDRLRCAGR